MQCVIRIKNGIVRHVNVNVKIIVFAKKIIVGIVAHVFVTKKYKTLIGSKPLRIIFEKIDGIIKFSVLFGTKKSDAIYDRIRYLINLKSSISYIFCHYFAKI